MKYPRSLDKQAELHLGEHEWGRSPSHPRYYRCKRCGLECPDILRIATPKSKARTLMEIAAGVEPQIWDDPHYEKHAATRERQSAAKKRRKPPKKKADPRQARMF